MSEYQTLRTDKDPAKLQKALNDFKDPVQIAAMYQAPDIGPNGFPDLTLYISGKGIPTVEIVFRHVFYWKLDNAPVVALEFRSNGDHRLLRLWHTHSAAEDKERTTSWILADSIEWKTVQDRFE